MTSSASCLRSRAAPSPAVAVASLSVVRSPWSATSLNRHPTPLFESPTTDNGISPGARSQVRKVKSMATLTANATAQLTRDEILRYSRHLIMPEVGMDGQLKIKQAKVLCIGAGGLGSPLALYLAAAGVGRLGMVDFDVVDFTNLQRQVIHGTSDVGKPK